MKRHLLPQRAHYYKANLHMHTTLSDGRMTPEEVKEAYKNRGYSILAYTDHEAIVPHNDLRDESFLPITSFEIATGEQTEGLPAGSNRTYHLNLYAKDPQNAVSSAFMVDYIWGKIEHIKAYINEEQFRHSCQRTYSVECMNDIIARAKEEGFLVSYNHPTWSLQDENDYAELKGVWGVEVYNTGCDRMGYLDTVHPMETLLRRGEFVFPLATDDAHKLSDCFGGWTMVGADRLEYSDVMQALENGDFYASTGPEWTVADALEAEDGTVITLTATVESIYQAYNSSYNNISVYLTDASGASIIAFRLTGNVHIGDLITVTGTITTYATTGIKQFAQGCTFEMVEEHNCAEYATEATCTMGSACSSCGEAVSDALGHADEDGDDLCDRCELNLNADYVPSWKLVTDLSQLKAGMQVVIATAPSTSLNFALGSDAGNYRKNVAITVNADGTLNVADGVEILTLVDGATDGSFGFQASNGYLYGLSGSNYLKTKSKLEADGSWTISIAANGVATISANCGGTTRYIKYNDQSPRFSGYKSGQKDVCIYAYY